MDRRRRFVQRKSTSKPPSSQVTIDVVAPSSARGVAAEEDKMFRCDNCKQITQKKEPQTKIVVETRPREYEVGFDDLTGLPIMSKGSEIVKEINLCPKCVKEHEDELIKSTAA